MTNFPAVTKYSGDDTVDQDEHRQLLEDGNAATKELLGGGAEEELTIAAGALPAPTVAAVRIRGQGAAADTLDTIPTTNQPDGRYLLLRAGNVLEPITLTEGGSPGLSLLYGGDDHELNAVDQSVLVQNQGGSWQEISRHGREKLHVVGSAGEPAFLNSWTGGAVYGLKFFKDTDNIVHVAGHVQNVNPESNGISILNMPLGWRPPPPGSIASWDFFCWDQTESAIQFVRITSTNGLMQFVRIGGTTDDNTFIGMSFTYPANED